MHAPAVLVSCVIGQSRIGQSRICMRLQCLSLQPKTRFRSGQSRIGHKLRKIRQHARYFMVWTQQHRLFMCCVSEPWAWPQRDSSYIKPYCLFRVHARPCILLKYQTAWLPSHTLTLSTSCLRSLRVGALGQTKRSFTAKPAASFRLSHNNSRFPPCVFTSPCSASSRVTEPWAHVTGDRKQNPCILLK